MKYRVIEKLGVKVSALGFGGSSLGGVFRDIDEAEAIRSVHVALDHGITLIDTAPYYGATRAEVVLGKALNGIPRDHYLLATKVARYGPDAADFDFSAERVLRSVGESLARLGVDYVDSPRKTSRVQHGRTSLPSKRILSTTICGRTGGLHSISVHVR